MVTVNKKIAANTGTATFELLGLSTDTKPTGMFSGYRVSDNSVYMELDTGDIYYFDEGEWQKMSTSGQGGGITVDDALDLDSENPVQNKVITAALAAAKPLIVTGTWASEGGTNTVTITTPLADIYAAAQAGRAVYLEYTNTDSETGGTDTTRMALEQRVKTPNQSNPGEYDYEIVFGAPYISGSSPVVVLVGFENSLVGEVEQAAAQ